MKMKTYSLIDKYEVIFVVGYLVVVAALISGAYLLSTLFS